MGVSDAYLRFPHLHGDLITFVAEDDVWLAPLDGGRAWRVSADQVPVANPRFSPDGTHLAWTSYRDVEPEVHVAAVDGGPSRRLTHWGAVRTAVIGWTPDGDVLATSNADQPQSRRTWAYAAPLDGTTPRRLPFGPVGAVAYGPGSAVLLGSRISTEPAWWKRYRGGTTGRLWVDRDGSGEFTRILSEMDASLVSPMWVGERIAFLSDHEETGALYSCLPDGNDLRAHGRHEFYARNASTDGTRVIYHSAGELWLVDGLDAEPRKLEVRLGGPRSSRQPYPISAGDSLGAAAPDHTGRGSAVEVRGTLHWVTHRDGPVRALSVRPGVRARLPQVLGQQGHALWVTDAEGDDALEIAPADGTEAGASPRRIGAGQLGRVLELVAAPDGRRAAVVSHDGRVVLVNTDSGELREVSRSTEGDPTGLAFSPDSTWLAWSEPGQGMLRRIRMANTSDLSIVDVTPLRFVDYNPVFTHDGKHVAFLSVRSFDPSYDEHVFDMFFANGCRPHLVPLSAITPSPFAPQLRGRPFGDPDEDKDEDSGKHSDDEPPRTSVDIEGLAERVVPFPVEAARYSSLHAVKGGLLWMHEPAGGELGHHLADVDDRMPKPSLVRYDLRKRTTETIVDSLDRYWVSGDASRLVVREGRVLRVRPADSKGDTDDEIDVDLSRIRVEVNPGHEWAQAYDEAGRLMRDHFWRADMGGVDWNAQLARYRPLLDRLGSHGDLVDVLWELQGELGTSHAYVMPADDGVDPKRRVGLLGADLERDGDGVWRVVRTLPGDTSDPEARSPLRAPGVAVRPGDAIVAVDGRPVPPEGPAALLVGTANKPVELVIAPAGGGSHRRAVVVPLLDDTPLRYQAWVAGRREYTHTATDGKVGYLHVPDMIASGWAHLHRDMRLEMRRDALVVDVRENRGGHLSELVVEKLARRIIGWQTGPEGRWASSYPSDAPRGPVVAISDEFSGSDGDIVTAAIKALGIGPVVGMRTWGGTIGIDMRYRLVDGTMVTQPRYASWMEGPGWGVENRGVEPDVEVPMTPADYAAGRDPQLDTAIRLALQALETRSVARCPEIPPL